MARNFALAAIALGVVAIAVVAVAYTMTASWRNAATLVGFFVAVLSINLAQAANTKKRSQTRFGKR